MKTSFLLLAAILLVIGAVIFFQGCSSCSTSPQEMDKMEDSRHNLKIEELKARIDSGKSITILDARSSIDSKIPGAKNLPAGSSDKKILTALPDKNTEIVTYCASLTCGASNKLATQLIKLGYTNVKEYPEGIKGWIDSGNKIEKVSK